MWKEVYHVYIYIPLLQLRASQEYCKLMETFYLRLIIIYTQYLSCDQIPDRVLHKLHLHDYTIHLVISYPYILIILYSNINNYIIIIMHNVRQLVSLTFSLVTGSTIFYRKFSNCNKKDNLCKAFYYNIKYYETHTACCR